MNIKEIYDIIDFFQKTSLTKLSLKNNDFSLYLEATEKVKSNLPLDYEKNNIIKNRRIISIKSPTVGKLYYKTLLHRGMKVNKGDVLFTIETMKIMNDYLCPEDGTIEEILVDSDEYVEYDQVIVRLKENEN